jgi:hypothetical protein
MSEGPAATDAPDLPDGSEAPDLPGEPDVRDAPGDPDDPPAGPGELLNPA